MKRYHLCIMAGVCHGMGPIYEENKKYFNNNKSK